MIWENFSIENDSLWKYMCLPNRNITQCIMYGNVTWYPIKMYNFIYQLKIL